MRNTSQQEAKHITLKRKYIFRIISILLPFIFLLLIELCLRLFAYGEDFSLFISVPDAQFSDYKMCNPSIGKKYFQSLDYSVPGNDIFLKEKPENGFRVFILGSSSVVGFPYGRNLMFTRILNKRLEDVYPEKHIEVINTAITATNSITLLDYMNDILKEEPDAILLYAGHNEFYGALGPGSNESFSANRTLIRLHLGLLNMRLYQLIRNSIIHFGKAFNKEKPGTRGTLMTLIVKNKQIDYQSYLYNNGIEQFRKNLGNILKKAGNKNVPVFISEVVSNVCDIEPLSYSSGGKPDTAYRTYLKGKELEYKKDIKRAKELYYLAKDLDGVRFRASEDINKIVRELTSVNLAILVPTKTRFEQKSPGGIIGNTLITEHVHPNIEGQFILAESFFNVIVSSNIITTKNFRVKYRSPEYFKRNWGYTELDSLIAVHKVNNLKNFWPYCPIDKQSIDYKDTYKPISFVDSLALRAVFDNELNNIDAHFLMAHHYEKLNDYYHAYKEYQAIITTDPINLNAYLNGAANLMNMQDFPMALDFLYKSIGIKETFEAYFHIGNIHLLKREFTETELSYQKAFTFASDDEQKKALLLKQLDLYFFNDQPAKQKATQQELKKIIPDFKPAIPEQLPDYQMMIPVQVRCVMNQALESVRKGEVEKALELALKSLSVKETALANRMVGEILINNNNENAIIFLLRAYPELENDLGYLNNLCIYYIKFGDTEKAGKILDEMKKLDPAYPTLSFLEQKIR